MTKKSDTKKKADKPKFDPSLVQGARKQAQYHAASHLKEETGFASPKPKKGVDKEDKDQKDFEYENDDRFEKWQNKEVIYVRKYESDEGAEGLRKESGAVIKEPGYVIIREGSKEKQFITEQRLVELFQPINGTSGIVDEELLDSDEDRDPDRQDDDEDIGDLEEINDDETGDEAEGVNKEGDGQTSAPPIG